MLGGWRHAYVNGALAGGNLAFLLLALKFTPPTGFGLAAGLAGTTSLYAWYANLRRFRAVADTPTSRISSAPLGYIELAGKGVLLPGERLIGHISGIPCLWYRYLIEEKIGNGWRHMDSGVSSEPFGLDDGTGMVQVDPIGAEILTSNQHVETEDDYRKIEWTLREGERLYVLGEHVTLGGAAINLDFHQDVSDLLAEWKRDRADLLKRFDLDDNGDISLAEWELARRAARRQIEQVHRAARLQNVLHLIRKPPGRMYLIANRTPKEMVSRYRLWAWFHLALLFSICMTVAFLL
jgi:hypothetical protein